ncbi:MAG: hypothetical protein ABSG79_21890 [Bryobacteraceae bacterium]|jgi:uncharacterized protein (DUF697 family)
MLKAVKQARAAVGLLNPDEVRRRARQPVRIGLVAFDSAGYAAMEDFLAPAATPRESRLKLLDQVYRAGDPGAPDKVDLVLYQQGIPCPQDAYLLRFDDPAATVAEILRDHDDLELALARWFVPFRKPVVERIIHAVSRENAVFAVATALPNLVPSLGEIPWAFGEFASDTAFLTANQVRMAFLIAAACGKEVGYSQRAAEILSIAAGAFGWRALARELAGKIPFGGGIIPKGAIAYAGTFVIGKGLEHYHHAGAPHTRAQREEVYQAALERGKAIVEGLRARL